MIGPGFVGHKLRIARTFRGIGEAELGERLGVGRTLVAQLEADARRPAPELIPRLAVELGFGAPFFEAPLADALRDEECHGLRGQAPRRRALAHASLLAELVAWLDDRVRLPGERLPGDVAPGDPAAIEAAAAACRSLWGLAPDLPLPNLVRVVERAGVVVAQGREGPAFARVGRRLLVVLDAAPPGGDARFALARLAGHVVLHRGVDAGHDGGRLRALEAEAARFASALLLPRDGLLRELPRAPSLDATVLVPLARRWKVSLATLVRRAAELPIANAARYRDASEHFSNARSRPERTALDPDEAPEVVALALQQLEQGLGIRQPEVARRLGWSSPVFASVTGLDSGREGSNVVSLAAWKARRSGAPIPPHEPVRPSPRAPRSSWGTPESAPRPRDAQLELDFGPPPPPDL